MSVSPSQNITGNNAKYLRFYWEVADAKIGPEKKWVFYAKGGGFRKWYGNMIDVVDWSPQARYAYKTGHGSQIIPEDYWYKKGITWGIITVSVPSFRVLPAGSTYDKGGSSIFINNPDSYNYVLGLINSCVFYKVATVLNPTIHLQVKDIRTMPVIFDNRDIVTDIVSENIQLCNDEWDDFEISKDFKKHPLI